MKLSLPSTLYKTPTQSPRRLLISLLTMTMLFSVGCSGGSQDQPTPDSDIAEQDQATSAAPSINENNDANVVSALQSNLKASGIDETIISAVPTDIPDMYWVTADGLPSFFTDAKGQFIIQGQIVQVGGDEPVDISAQLSARSAKEKLAALDKKDMVIFPAKGETKGVVYAFTDADCGYCRKLHQEIDQTNDLGIEVRYLAWPRSDETIPKMEAIWCSEDRQAAMTQAKAGADIAAPNCQNPVLEELQLGMTLGVRGTPAIFNENGQNIGGYLPPKQIAEALGIS